MHTNVFLQAVKVILQLWIDIRASWITGIDGDRGNFGGSKGQAIDVLLALFVFLVRSTIRTGLGWSALMAHLGEFHDIQCSLHDAFDDGTSGWRKSITELFNPTEDAEDSGGDHFSRLEHRCSG